MSTTSTSSCPNPTSNDEQHVFVRATFSIPSHLAHDDSPEIYNHLFNEFNCSQMSLGLPEGLIPSKVSLFDNGYFHIEK
jgi:hypothetical protein